MSDTGPAPGWYADPGGGAQWRWWSGVAWTEHTSAAVGTSRAELSALLDAEQRITGVALWAMLAYCGCALVYVAAADSVARQFASEWHWLRQAIHQLSVTGNGSLAPLPPLQQGSWIQPWLSVVSLVEFGAMVLLLIWQYRSANVARALGYPAKRGPGWGVACWFVPVVNLWMPYGAVRDLLPVGHEARPVLRAWWCAVLVLVVLSAALPFLLAFAHRVGLVCYPFAVVAPVALGWLGCRVVRTVSSAHRAAAASSLGAHGASW